MKQREKELDEINKKNSYCIVKVFDKAPHVDGNAPTLGFEEPHKEKLSDIVSVFLFGACEQRVRVESRGEGATSGHAERDQQVREPRERNRGVLRQRARLAQPEHLPNSEDTPPAGKGLPSVI